MTAIHTIVTHPGGAHKDDLLACSVLVAENPEAVVLRRDPAPADLADPAVAVVDVGGSHDPARSNFDHHQFPREHAPTCALSLVLDGLGLYQDALRFCDWLETAEWFDSRGPKRTAEWLGAPREAVARLTSPVDMTLLRRFADAPEHRPGELVHHRVRARPPLARPAAVGEEHGGNPRIDFGLMVKALDRLRLGTQKVGVALLTWTSPSDRASNRARRLLLGCSRHVERSCHG